MAVLTSAWASYAFAYACTCITSEGLDLYTTLFCLKALTDSL